MSQRKALFKDVSIYALSAYSAQILDIVNGVLIRRFLGAASMGLWSFLQVFLVYAKHAGLGITSATIRDIPYYRGKGDFEQADEIKNLVFTFTLVTSVLVALGVFVYALFSRTKISTPFFIGLLVIAVLIVLQRIYNLFVTLLRAYKEFVFAGYLNFISSVTSIIFALALTYRFKIYGFFAGLILNFLLSIGLILWRTPHRFRIQYSWPKLQPLLQFGTSMLILDILRSTLTNVDRIMVARFLGFKALGIYSVALMVNNFIYNFPTILVAIFPPYFQETYGKRDHAADLEKTLLISTLALSYVLSFLIGYAWIFAPWFVHRLLPEYVAGITPLRFLIVGSFFLALTHSFSTFVVTIRRHLLLLPITIFSIGLGFALIGVFLGLHLGLMGVAIGTGVLYATYFLSLALFSFRQLFPWPRVMQLIARILVPLAYVLAAIVAVHLVIPAGGHLFFKGAVLRSLFFGILSVPLFFFMERETGLLSTAYEVLLLRKKAREQPIAKEPVEIEEESPDRVKP